MDSVFAALDSGTVPRSRNKKPLSPEERERTCNTLSVFTTQPVYDTTTETYVLFIRGRCRQPHLHTIDNSDMPATFVPHSFGDAHIFTVIFLGRPDTDGRCGG